jgi:hypothetical protein
LKSLIKNILRPFVPKKLLNFRRKLLGNRQLREWQKRGFPSSFQLLEWQKRDYPIPPPDIIKQITVQEYQQKYGYTTFVETGTYLGDMVEAQKNKFKKVISVELSIDLFEKALLRFKNEYNIIILQGDSGKVLPEILRDIYEPAIFWLDAHYSTGITAKGNKECPIFEELDAIFSTNKFNHIILIDDARCFIGRGDFPTVEKLTKYVKSRNKNYKVELKNDIIRYVI